MSVNPQIVNFLRNNGNAPDTIADVPDEFKFLQRIAANEDAGNRLFRMIWKEPSTEGRFRAIGGWKPEFKGYKSILWFLSEELRNGISHNGVNLIIDFRKTDDENITIDVSLPEKEGVVNEPISIPMRTEGDWEQLKLNGIIKTYREQGILQRPDSQGDLDEEL